MNPTLSRAEVFALNNTLACCPDNTTYKQVQQMLRNGDESISVWEPMGYWDIDDIIDFQDSLRDQINELLAEVTA
jgi:hypothetical protein